MDKKEWIVCFLQALAVTLLVDYLFYSSWWLLLLTPVMLVPVRRYRRGLLEKRRKKRILRQFHSMMTSLCVALRAGYSMENALAESWKDLQKLYGDQAELVRELRYIIGQMQISVPVERLLENLGKRTKAEDIQSFAAIYAIAKRTGGNLEQVLQATAGRLWEKMETEDEIEACVAAKRMEERLMGCMPCGILLYLRLLSPGFLDPMYGNPVGILVMTVCLILYGVALYMGERIVDIEV